MEQKKDDEICGKKNLNDQFIFEIWCVNHRLCENKYDEMIPDGSRKFVLINKIRGKKTM